MRHVILLFLIFAACNTDVKVDTPVTDVRATFASMRNEHAPNVAVSNYGVTATYLSPDASFTLRFDQCAVIELDGKIELVDAAVFQVAPGIFVADMRNGDYIRLNTQSGRTDICHGMTYKAIFEHTNEPTP